MKRNSRLLNKWALPQIACAWGAIVWSVIVWTPFAWSEDAKPDVEEECWSHVTDVIPGVRNRMHMCFMGARVNVLIEFPNVGSTPTICVQEGGKTEAANGFIVRLAPGSCRNGRSLDPLSMLCMKDDGEGRSLACKDRAGRDVLFHPAEIEKAES